jgi:hypothetical protein
MASTNLDRKGIGCENDAERAKENYLVAAELCQVNAMVDLGEMCDKDDPQRFVWFGKAAVLGSREHFWREMREKVLDAVSGVRCSNLIFAIGRALKGHVDKRKIFGEHYNLTIALAPQIMFFVSTNFNCDLIEEQ